MKKWFIFPALLLASACSTDYKLEKMSLQEKVIKANEFYEAQEYSSAIAYYEDIVFLKIGSTTRESSFRLAKSYMQTKQYDLAVLELQNIKNTYPNFHKMNEVYFSLALSYHNLALPAQFDQKETYQEIEALEEFIDLYKYDKKIPEAKKMLEQAKYKLVSKKYHNGHIYYKIYDYSSALMYFDEVFNELKNKQADIYKLALYYTSLIYIEQNKLDDAISYGQDLQYYFPESKEALIIKEKINKFRP